jgi:PAS domain S-box-containing protein
VEESTWDSSFWRTILHPDDVETITAIDARSARTKEPFSADYRLRDASGEYHWFHDDAVFLPAEEDGRPAYWLGVLVDTTERRGAESDRAETEQRFRAIVEQIPATTYVNEVDGPDEGIYVSPQIHDLLGFEPKDWYAEPEFWRNHIHPQDRQEVWADWRRQVNECGVFAREYRMVARDGSVVWVSERTTILPDESGQPQRIQGVLIDISKLKQAEGRFRTVFEASPVGIVIVGNDFGFLDANPAFCRLLGYTRDEVRNLSFVDITHPDDVSSDADLARQVFAGEIPSYSLEKRYITRDGETIWVNLTASGVRDDSGAPLYGIGIVEDVTARRHMEAETLHAAAAALQRLAELTVREREVIDLMAAQGLTARQIAAKLHLSTRTAESHLASVYRKLGVTSGDSAVTEYRRLLAAGAAVPAST